MSQKQRHHQLLRPRVNGEERSARHDALFESPAFPLNTFWSLKATCAVSGAQYAPIPLGLITLTAMLPRDLFDLLVAVHGCDRRNAGDRKDRLMRKPGGQS